uniref:Nudix hydrolase domain-containing protein n=1 Tax=Peronospora matthiolae TaxID=2874970 RepID=A0AAV1UBD1_9STRA
MSIKATGRPFVNRDVVASLIPRLQRNLSTKQLLSYHDAPPVGASVAAVFRWRDKTKHSLELLFVRRCVNEKDAWSGQVAFPGGRRQTQQTGTTNRSWGRDDAVSESTKWESLRETAQRETKEEVGLDLTLPYVHWIGSLPPLQTHLSRSLHVSTQVFFIDVAAEEHEYTPKLQACEIADVFWVDVQELFNPRRYQVLSYPLEQTLRVHPRVLALVKKLLGDMLFDCIYLSRPYHPLPDDKHLPRRDVHDFVLWGLTLRAVTHRFAAAGSSLPVGPIAQQFEKSKILGGFVLYCMRKPLSVVVGATAFLSSIVVAKLVYTAL